MKCTPREAVAVVIIGVCIIAITVVAVNGIKDALKA